MASAAAMVCYRNRMCEEIQRRDQDVKEVVALVNHVTLYKLEMEQVSEDTNGTGIRGGLAVLRRASNPTFKLVAGNIAFNITDGFEFAVSQPYLVFKSSVGIRAVKFQEACELHAIAAVLEGLH